VPCPLAAQALDLVAAHSRLVAGAAADQRGHLVGARPRPDREPGERRSAERGRVGVCRDFDRATGEVGLELHQEPVGCRSAVRPEDADL
jgi:hypothetical protein